MNSDDICSRISGANESCGIVDEDIWLGTHMQCGYFGLISKRLYVYSDDHPHHSNINTKYEIHYAYTRYCITCIRDTHLLRIRYCTCA